MKKKKLIFNFLNTVQFNIKLKYKFCDKDSSILFLMKNLSSSSELNLENE